MRNEELRQKLRDSDFEGAAEVKIVDADGNIFEIKDVKFSLVNGGELHIEFADYDD